MLAITFLVKFGLVFQDTLNEERKTNVHIDLHWSCRRRTFLTQNT